MHVTIEGQRPSDGGCAQPAEPPLEPDSRAAELELDGPHGSPAWARVFDRWRSARRRRVGQAPEGGFSLGAYASGMGDLLIALRHECATCGGHSLRGGVAMPLAYQFRQHSDNGGGLVCDVGLRVHSDVGEVLRRQASVLGGGDSPRLVRLRSELIETSVPARVDAGRRRRSKG
jgi:pimeloyl-ACP methyl ester carboxylesterase